MSSHKVFDATLIFVVVLVVSAFSVAAQQIVGSDRHASILCLDGVVFSWGENQDALLGDGTTKEYREAVRAKVSRIKSLNGRYAGVVAVDRDGNVFAWGGVEQNQFGMPSWEYIEPLPKRIPYVSGVKKAIAGSANGYYLLADGRLFVSGQNSQGQYGNGTTISLDSGCSLVPVNNIVDVFCAVATAFAVQADGTILAWGSNQENQIDTTSEPFYSEPRVVLITNGIVSTLSTSGGFTNSMGSMRVVTIEGEVFVWGQNDKKQLGVSDSKWVKSPTKLAMPGKVVAVSGGLYHTVVLLADGTVWTWGDNGFGQLGNPYYQNTVEPVKAIGLANVVAIGSGSYSSYAITRDGSLHGWGDNTYRQLNLDGAPRQYTAVPLPVPCGLVSSVSSHGQTTIASSTPSPVIDVLTVFIKEGTTTVEVFSMQRRSIRRVQPSLTATSVSIDMSSEPLGVYTIVRTRGSVVSTEMVFKY